MERINLFASEPDTEVIQHDSIVIEPTVKPVAGDNIEAQSELMTLLDTYGQRFWRKGGQHLKNDLSKARRFDSLQHNASLP